MTLLLCPLLGCCCLYILPNTACPTPTIYVLYRPFCQCFVCLRQLSCGWWFCLEPGIVEMTCHYLTGRTPLTNLRCSLPYGRFQYWQHGMTRVKSQGTAGVKGAAGW